jgi:hypothetical protein
MRLYYTLLHVSPLSLTCRVEEVSRMLGPTGQTPLAGLGQAQAAWCAVFTPIPSMSFGVSIEQSPTKLPDPVQEPLAFQSESRMSQGSIGRERAPGPFNPVAVDIPFFGRRQISESIPFLLHSFTPQGFALSVIVPGISYGTARTRPLLLDIFFFSFPSILYNACGRESDNWIFSTVVVTQAMMT